MSVQPLHRHQPEWTFGDRLRKVRRDNHLTQMQLADILGVTSKAVDAWEGDRNLPRDLIRTATRIEDRFRLVRGWMLGYAEGPTAPKGDGSAVAGAGFEPATSGLRAPVLSIADDSQVTCPDCDCRGHIRLWHAGCPLCGRKLPTQSDFELAA